MNPRLLEMGIKTLCMIILIKRHIRSINVDCMNAAEDMKLQPNPAYGTSDKVVMDNNPAYQLMKWFVQ